MGTTRKFLRNMDKVTLSSIGKATKLQKVVSAVTAMGFVLQPVAAMASVITRADGTKVEVNNNVADVWAKKVINDEVALNVFKQFDITPNDIANMYFSEDKNGKNAANLVNMVGSKININGTVNAIRNNKIGGNLYFLSSDGIAVGATGVINAGSLTMMTPTESFMKLALGAAKTDGTIEDAINAFGANTDVAALQSGFLVTNWDKIQNMKVAMNKSGTITVNGNINTTDGIRMKAAHIDIGKDSNANTLLQSGILDFSNYVNTTNFKDTNGNSVNVNTKLTAAEANDGSGDIVLSAVANTVNEDTGFAGVLGKNVYGDNTVQATVDIGEHAQLIANEYKKTNAEGDIEKVRGGIDISATATSGGGDAGLLGIDVAGTTIADIIGSKIVKTDAKINIDGKLTADSINVAANAENSFEKGSLTEVGGLVAKGIETISNYIPLDQLSSVTDNVEIGYAKLASNAEVTIGSNATLTATGEDTLKADANDDGLREGGALNISAISKVSAEVGATVEPDEGGEEAGNQGKAAATPTAGNKKKQGNSLSKIMPAAGVSVVDTDNSATVTINGKLDSKGDANVSAHALSEVEAESGVSTIDSDEGSQYVNAAVTVANINNASNVTLNGTTTVAGELNALAAAKNEVSTVAATEVDNNGLVSSAINITDAKSNADLKIGGAIEVGSMKLAAENTISNEIQATTELGKRQGLKKSVLGKGALGSIFSSAENKSKNSSKVKGLGKYFNAGAAVTVVDEANNAKVTVQKGANLTSTGDIAIAANNNIEDSFISATSAVNNYNNSASQKNTGGAVSGGTSTKAAVASAAVISADLANSAQFVIEGNDSSTSVPEIKGANVDIKANSSFEYDRLKSMWEDFKDEWGGKLTDNAAKNLYDKIADAMNNYQNDDVDAALNLADLISTASELKDIPATLQSFKDDLLEFIDISNYSSFYTAASTKSGVNNDAKLAVTGSININSIKNNAQVVIGKNAKIEASKTNADNTVTKGELNISATAKQHDVALNGKTKYFIPTISNTSGGATAIGGSVGVHDADVNSLIAIGEGASLTANDVNLKAENDLQHTAITFGGGAATNDGLTGMFAYMEGQSNSIISVDDEASINAANKLALDAANNSTISNIIFDRTSAGNSAIGAAVGIVDYKVNNIAAIADNDSDSNETRDEVKDLHKLVYDQLAGKDEDGNKTAGLNEQLGTKGENETKGTVTANEVAVNAKTSGTITGVSVAGVTAGANQKNNKGTGTGFKIPAKIAGAGSASVNTISGNTAALLEGVEVTTTGTNGNVSVSAKDESMIGAYSGAAALKKKGKQSSAGGFSATLAGAIAYNDVQTGVTAQIKDAVIKNAAKINNVAAREGAVVAAGLALGVDTTGQGGGSNATTINAGVSASINEIDNSTHAVMDNVATSISGGDNTASANTNIDNIAQSKDIQIAGGITAQYAKGGGIGIGAAVSSLNAKNDIQSKITGSTLNNVGDLKAYAASDLVQVGTVLSAGVIQGQNGNAVEAAVANNQLENKVNVTISGGSITANNIDAKAYDGEIQATTTHLKDLSDDGFETDGKDTMNEINGLDENGRTHGADVSIDKNKLGKSKKDAASNEQGDEGKEVNDFSADSNKGNLIISGAASIIANTSSQGKVTAGAAVVNQKIKNNFTTNITGTTITADTVKANAESDTLMVGVAAGAAVSTGANAVANLAGSAGVMQLENNTTTTIENANVTAKELEAKAATKSRLINVAGQVSVSKGKAAAGLATATNVLNNTTGAYIYGSNITGKAGNVDTKLTVEADNNSEAYAIAVGVAAQVAQQGAALNGDVAVNKGVNNTEAIIGKSTNGNGNTITNVDDLDVKAVDNTKLKAISGGVTVSTGNAGLGGAVAYNQIGDANGKQSTVAKLTDTVITTDKATTIDVNAEDTSKMLAIAVGAAVQTGQSGAAAQGSAATTVLHKNVEAAVSNVDIDKNEDKHNASLNVNAKSTAEAITSADVVAFSTANFAGGAAVAVTNSKSDTKASITGGSMNLKGGKVQADSKVDIINVGIGVAAATGQGGSIAGNVAVNNIGNNTTASINNATMNASGTIGVLADSKEHIRNYAGALAATVGQGYAAGGLSTAVNVISGDTSATVSGSKITAAGDDGGIEVTEYAKDSKSNKKLTGLVVNADSAHEIDNVVVTGGAAITAEAAVAASGTVTVNTINGSTVAGIDSTNVNSDNSSSIAGTADVSVRANDNTEIDSHVGSAAVAASANAGVSVGEASDSNVMNRKVTAQIVGDSTSKNTVNADKLTVNAFNKHDILSNAIGIAAAGGAYAGVGVSGTTSVLKTTAETTAQIANINSTNNGLTINADHVNKVQMFGNSAVMTGAIGGASVGTAIAVLNDGSKTEAKLSGSAIKHYSDNSAVDVITAKNDTDVLSEAANAAVSASIGAGVSGVITVNNMDNAVYTTIKNSTIGEESGNKAQSITAKADNKLKTAFASGTGSVGLGAAEVGVGVNTIDTSVVTDVSNSSLYAKDVTLLADEDRDISQTAVSVGVGGIGVNASVLVTNIGTTVSDEYGVDTTDAVNEKGEDANGQELMKDGDKVNISNAYTNANKAIDNQNKVVGSDKKNTVDALGGSGDKNVLGSSSNVKDADGNVITVTTSSGLTNDELKNNATAGRGGRTDAKGVKVNVSGSTIKVIDKADIKADATTDAKITVGNGSAAAVAVGATVGILNVERNSGVNITDSSVTAKTIDVKSNQDGTSAVKVYQGGTSAVKVYQGGMSGSALNVVYSGVHLTGQNDINLKGATLAGASGVTVATGDTSTAKLETIGVSGALISSANIFVVDGKNDSSSTITVDSEGSQASTLTSDNGDVVITAKHGEDVIDVAAAINEAQEKLNIAQADYNKASEEEKATKKEALDAAQSRLNELKDANSKLTKAETTYNAAKAAYDAAKDAYNQASEADKADKMEAVQTARNNLTEAEFDLQKAQQQAKIAGATEKATMDAKIIPVAVAGMTSGLGFNAMVEDKSSTIVDIKDNQQFKAENDININAINNSVNKVSSVAVNAALGAAIGATGVQAKGNAISKLNVGNNNVFKAERVKLGAEANVVNDAKITSVGAGFGSFMVNWATASANTNVDVKVGDNLYKTANVDITGKSDITQRASATGFVAGMYTSGTNLAKVDAKDTVNVEVAGNKADSNESANNNVNITAEGVVNQLADTNGYGGAYVDLSPAAAITKSKIDSTTNAKVTGKWNVNTINVNAKHDNVVDLDTDAVKAAVVGLSGVWAFNDIKNNTNVNLTNSSITANSNIGVKALNDISYRNKIWAGGYGAIAGNALIADDDITLNAKVNIGDEEDNAKKALITSKNGAINIGALADGGTHDKTGRPLAAIKKDVVIKSAGVVAGSLAFSSDDIAVNNTINVNADSVLETKGSVNNASKNNITLSAADRLSYADEATADTQGGVVGAASTDMDVTMNRRNTINVAGKIDSNYDAVLDAGDSSVLNMVLKSNAYNRTAAPLVANPSLDYTLNQTNTINLKQGSTVQSTRDIELAATTGDTTLATQSQSWKWTDGGMTGNASIASTAYGDGVKVGNSNNTVKVDGTVVAGKNTDLTITIKDVEGGQEALEQEITNNQGKKGTIPADITNALNTAQAAYEEAKVEKENAEQAVSKLNVELTKLENEINSAGAKDADLKNQMNNAEAEKNTAETAMNTAKTEMNTASDALNTKVNELYKQYNSEGTDITFEVKKAWLDNNNSTLESDDKTAYTNCLDSFEKAQKVFNTASDEYDSKNAAYTEAKNAYDTNYALITDGAAERTRKQNELTVAKEKADKYNDKNSNEYKNFTKLLTAYQEAQKKYDAAEEEATGATKINTLVFGTRENLGKNLDGNKSYVEITASDWYTQANGSPAENVKLQNYAVRLTNKLTEINEMIQQYAGTKIEDVYKAERDRIYSELQALGLAHYDKALKQYVVSNEQSTVPTVELKNITVTGGNVSIKGDKLNGNGNITANGNPNVTINNESSYYLKVKDITVDGEGGKVNFNNASVAKADNININAKRGDLVSDAIGNNATVTINVSDKANASKKEGFTPDVGIVGTISNPYGTIKIDNKASSIYVTSEGSIKGRSIQLSAKGSVTQGYTDGIYNVGSDPSAAVSSDVIEKIQAGIIKSLGDISQSGKYYTAFSSVENLAKFLYYNGIGSSEAEAKTIAEALTGQTQDETKGIYAGGAIYINAANINVNGTIQSGYDSFKLEVKQGAVNSTILSANGTQLQDNSYYQNDNYLVSNGSGPVYENGKFIYKIKAWYNPYTKEIFTEDIDQSGGGRIYLAGAIANTNSKGGKLLALDGGANIEIDASAKDINLQIGKINADNVEGQITIVDTATGTPTITVYKRSGNEKITINDIEQNNIKVTYDPQKQMYQFTNGETSQVITSYKHVRDSSWFGLDVDKTTTSQMKNDVDNISSTSTTADGKQTLRNDVIDNGSVDGYDYINVNGYQEGKLLGGNLTIKIPKTVSSTKGDDTIYQITLDRYVSDTAKESEKVVKKSKKGLLGLWGSTTTTTWTETKGAVSAYNYGIKADNPIEIGFIGNKAGSTVKITGAKDVTLAGDIRAGSVNVEAKNGSVVTNGFDSSNASQQTTIYTDKLNLTATKGNIKVLQQGVNKALDLTAIAGKNIDIKTLAGIKTGDVYLNNVNAGGNITLNVEGKVLTANTSTYATRSARSANINAGGLLTVNAAEGIGSQDNWIEVDIGKHANLKVANGNIYMRQLGDSAMSLEQVIAENGDVFLEAKGGFIDAIADNTVSTSNENAALTDWKKLGLLGNDGAADGLQNNKASQVENLTKQADNLYSFGTGENNALVSKGNALVEAVQIKYDDYISKQNSMYTAQAKLNEAVSDLNKSGTEANKSAYDSALTAYNKAFADYAQAKNTYETAKSNWISENVGSLTNDTALAKKAEGWLNSYETVQHSASSAHQWTARELMYAVQDSVINPKAGTITDVEKANVVGNNITLKTDGSFGVKDTQKTEIKIADMFKYNADGTIASGATSEADLKKLAAARADDVTWGTDTIVIERTKPITVQLNKKVDSNGNESYGNVKLETLTDGKIIDNIYMIAKDSALNLDQVIASGDVRLLAHKGIYSSKSDGDLNIIGKDITLEGGYGSIGTSTKAVLAGLLGGKINANAAGDIYLKQMASAPTGITLPTGVTMNSDMVLGSLAANNITINATGNIVSGMDKILDANGKVSEASGISYINASNLTLNTTAGSVGTANSGLRVKNSGGVVDIDAQNGAYLEAKGDGTLVLGTIKTGSNENDNFVVNSEGSLSVGREADAAKNITAVEGSINGADTSAKANVELTTANDLTFSGKVRANQLTTQSYAGDITQTTKEQTDNIEAEKLNVSAIAGDIKLANPHNVIKDIDIQGLGGNLDLVVSMDNLNLKLGSDSNALSNNYGGNFKITNNAGNINVKAANTNIYGDIELHAAKDITVKRDANDTTSKLELNTNKRYDGSNEALLQDHGNITLNAGENITNAGTITANAADTKDAEGNVVTAGVANITLNAKNVTNENALDAKTTVDIDATAGDIVNNSSINAGKDVDIDATAGNITNNSTITADKDVDLNASGKVENNAAITAANDAILTAGTSIESNANGKITSTNDTKLNAGTDITVGGALTATNGNVEATTTNGDVTINNTVKSGANTTVNAGTNGSVKVTNTGSINSSGNTSLKANGTGVIEVKGAITAAGSISGTTANGSITVDAAMKSTEGGIKLDTNNSNEGEKADITINGTLKSDNGNIETTTKQGDVSFNGKVNVAKGDVTNKVETGDVGFNAETSITEGSINNSVGAGDVKFNEKTNITTGSITNDVTTGNVEFNKETKVGTGDVTNNVGTGDVKFNGKTDITTGNINNNVGTGNVDINGATNVGTGNISTTVDNGNINFNAETNVNTGDIFTDAKNGNISHNANMTVGTGNIKDIASGTITSPRHDENAAKPEVKLESINGSINLETTGNGDINIYEVIANNGKADIKSKDGNVYLYKINGKEVILVTKSDIDAKHISADKLTTNGDDITLNIDQEKGMVIEELLATNNVNINKAKGSLDIEKLAVENKAQFDVNGMTTTVWGVAPKRDDSDSVYWFNVNAWKNGGDWMNLAFNEKQHIQSSNGALLRLRDYFYVYNQRFIAVDHLNQLLDENKADEYDINFKPEVVQYFRYDLYDLDELEQQMEDHAEPAKIVVEA